MRAESFEAVHCPVCGMQNAACACSFHDKCAFVSAPVVIRGWGHFTSRFANKARYGRNGTIRLTMWANVPAHGEMKVLERSLPAKNFLYQDKTYLSIMRRKAVHGLGLSVHMPRVDAPLFATAEATDFLNLHHQYVVSSAMAARKRRATSFATVSRLTGEPHAENGTSSCKAGRSNPAHLLEVSPASVQQLADHYAADMPGNGLPTANDGHRNPRFEECTASFMTSSFNCAPTAEHDTRFLRSWEAPFAADEMPSAQLDCQAAEHPSAPERTFALEGRSPPNTAARAVASNACMIDGSLPQTSMWDSNTSLPLELETVIDCNTFALGASVPAPSQCFPSNSGSVCSLDGDFDLPSTVKGNPMSAVLDRDSNLVPDHSSLLDLLGHVDAFDEQGHDIARAQGLGTFAGHAHGMYASTESQQPQTSQDIQGQRETQVNMDGPLSAEHSLGKHIDESAGQLATRQRRVSKRPRRHSATSTGLGSVLVSDIGNRHGAIQGNVADDRKHVCTRCGVRFKNRGDLQRHVKVVHEKKKSFSCNECGKQFGHSGHLNRHKASHRGERRFRCDKCGCSFFQASHLASHIEHIHSASRGRQHECSLCRLRVTSVHELRAHLHTDHQVMRCPVPTCGMLFGSNAALDAHSQFHNPISLTFVEDHLQGFASAE
jgi:uncharacterized C2H2 Zn-finger protein